MHKFIDYKKKVINKLNFDRIKNSKTFINRFYSEMASYFRCSFLKDNFPSLGNKKAFLYFFQIECIRSTQFGKILFTYDMDSLFSLNNNFWKFNFVDISYYQTVRLCYSLY